MSEYVVALLNLNAAKTRLLTAYRLGSQSRADTALAAIDRAKARLAALDREASGPGG